MLDLSSYSEGRGLEFIEPEPCIAVTVTNSTVHEAEEEIEAASLQPLVPKFAGRQIRKTQVALFWSVLPCYIYWRNAAAVMSINLNNA